MTPRKAALIEGNWTMVKYVMQCFTVTALCASIIWPFTPCEKICPRIQSVRALSMNFVTRTGKLYARLFHWEWPDSKLISSRVLPCELHSQIFNMIPPIVGNSLFTQTFDSPSLLGNENIHIIGSGGGGGIVSDWLYANEFVLGVRNCGGKNNFAPRVS